MCSGLKIGLNVPGRAPGGPLSTRRSGKSQRTGPTVPGTASSSPRVRPHEKGP